MNLLLIFSDQHTQSVAGCYGDQVIKTPNIDRLAAEGVTFDQAYSPSPLCVPARMAFLTGQYPRTLMCWTNSDALRSDVPTHAHALGAAGYDVSLVGRLHAIGPDQIHGYGSRDIGDSSTNWIGGVAHSLGELDRTNEPFSLSIERAGAGGSSYLTKDRAVTDQALSRLAELAARRSAGDAKPFALTVGYILPHQPYVCHADDFRYYEARVPDPKLATPANDHPYIVAWREFTGADTPTRQQVRYARAAYYGLVTEMDRMIGELLGALDDHGLAEDTLVVYVSDHGDHLGERGLWWKQTFYDESVKVPLLMRHPRHLPAGERRPQIVNLVDLTPTLVEALDANRLPNADGVSFWDVAENSSQPWVNETYSEYCTDGMANWTQREPVQQRMLRFEQWKLVYYHGQPPQLFDLESDPHEQRDLAGDLAHSKVKEQLVGKVLRDWDPEQIRQYQRRHRADKELLGEWARRVEPQEAYRWFSKMEDNWLENAGKSSDAIPPTET